MVKLFSLLVLSMGLFLGGNPEPEEDNCTLSVEFSNFRSHDGKLFIFIYNYENQYPDNPFKHYVVDKSMVRNSRLLVNINDLAKGKYAISILDDENNNEDLDRFFGIPTEGYGFSNNVKPMLSMPNYEDLLFDLNQKWLKLDLQLQYAL
ncbi:MAG: hypothetical protein ACI857_002411 [Arenicella sp.]|jgi:uncharacterized protein (DUF2141 family)